MCEMREKLIWIVCKNSYPEQKRAPGVASVRHLPQMIVWDLEVDEEEEEEDDAGDLGREGGGAGAGRCDAGF